MKGILILQERQLNSREGFVSSNDSQDSGFRTQLPLALDSQTSEQAQNTQSSVGKSGEEGALSISLGLTEVLGSVEVWQSGQHIVPTPSRSQASSIGASDLYIDSSEIFIPGTDKVKTTPSLLADVNISLRNSRHSDIADGPPVIKRNPSFHSGKTIHSAQSKEDILVTSIETPDFIAEDISTLLPVGAPSQPPEVLDSDIPPRSTTPSELDMSNELQAMAGPALQSTPLRSMSTGPGLREKLKSMRAASAAEAARKANLESSSFFRGSESPSIIPEPILQAGTGDSRLEVRTLEAPLPQRVFHTNLHTPANPSKLHLHKEISQMHGNNSLQLSKLGYMEFVVPLSLPARVKDQYVGVLDLFKATIERFRDDNGTDKRLINSMQHLLHRLNNVTTHIDLDNDTTLTQQDTPPGMLGMWAVDSSAKFQFLQQLIEQLRTKDVNIAIVANGGRLLDLIETFLKGLRVGYYRVDTGTNIVRDTSPSLQMTLIPSSFGIPVSMPVPVNLIIAFDTTVDQEIIDMQGVRTYNMNDGRMVPVVHLLVYCSAEHISRCLPPSVTGLDHLKMIVGCVVHNSENIGKLLPEEHSPFAAADEVAAFVNAGSLERMWTLPTIRPIGIDVARPNQEIYSTTQPQTQASSSGSNTLLGQHKRAMVSRVLRFL